MMGKRTPDTCTWEALGKPLLIRDQEEGRERYRNRTELFFSFLFTQLT